MKREKVVMKRCCFIGIDHIYDRELPSRIFDELQKIAINEDSIELWFDEIKSTFMKTCFLIALRLKNTYPNKDIKIIQVHDPSDFSNNIIKNPKNFYLPVCIPDKHIFSKRCDKNSINTYYKFLQWIYRNCNYIFSYNYPILKNRVVNRDIAFVKKLSQKHIIEFFFEETNQYIHQLIDDTFGEQTKSLFDMLENDKSINEIALDLGMSKSQVDTRIYDSCRHLRKVMMSKNIEFKKPYNTCALIGMVDVPTIPQLKLFDSFLEFILSQCRVNELWIEAKYLYTTYGVVLFKYAHQSKYEGVKIKVLVCADDSFVEWEKKTTVYAPLYAEVHQLKANSNDKHSRYKEIIDSCDYVVSDLISNEASLIRELCSNNKQVILFDVSYKGLTIDDQYVNTDII